jgi:predicted dehydrogenase
MLRVGIIGAGAMGAEHAFVLGEMADVEVAGVFSRTEARARAVAESCGAAAFTDAAALIGSDAVDAISVCTPSDDHAPFVLAALAAGKHVFCETPFALQLDEARRMRDAARAAGRLLQVGLLMRSVAPYAHVKALAASGEHGRLLSLSTWRLGSYLRSGSPEHKPHYSDPSTELMTFDFDFANWLLGQPARLTAGAAGEARGGPGEISALLAYKDGRHATVQASGLMPVGCPFMAGFRALFEGAAFELRNSFQQNGPPISSFTMTDDAAPPREVELAGDNPYAVELRRFVDCIAGRADTALLDADRAIEALVLSHATQASLASGARTVEIADWTDAAP